MTEAAIAHQELQHTPVSYSSLKKFREGGIHHYYRYKERELEQDESTSLSLGTLIDEFLLNRENFNDTFVLQDVEAPSSPNQVEFCTLMSQGLTKEEAYRSSYANPPKTASKLTEKAEALYNDLEPYIKFLPELATKTPYSMDDSFALNQINMNIMGHKKLGPIFQLLSNGDKLGSGESERVVDGDIEILTHVKLTGEYEGLPIRGELDLVVINHANKTVIVYDLKSTNYHLKNFKYEVRKYDYTLQAVLYTQMAYQSLVPKGYTLLSPRLIVCRTTGSFDCAIFSFPEAWIEQERTILREDFELLSWHYTNKKFKYPKEYYEGDGVLELDFLEDMDSWKANVEQQLS